MEWITEVMKSPFPVALVLGGGLVVVWRAFLAKDLAVIAAKDETIRVLLDVIRTASKS